MRAALVLAVLAVLAVATSPARADKTEATKLFEQGRALLVAGKVEQACPLFEKSFALERAVGTELNLADCDERLGHLADAWRMFDDAATQSERSGNTVPPLFPASAAPPPIAAAILPATAAAAAFTGSLARCA